MKPHLCGTCGTAFRWASDLKRHISTVHEGKKPHVCETCGRAFAKPSHLRRHIGSASCLRSQNAARDRECPICFECDLDLPELPCGHKLCAGCREQLCSASSAAGHFECPMCRKRVRA